MQHDIVDNRHVKLIEIIQQILPGCESANFAVGYFFVSGLTAVVSTLDVDNIKELRLLIGNVSNRETIEQIAEGYKRLSEIAGRIEDTSYPPRSQLRTIVDAAAQDVKDMLASMQHTDEEASLITTLTKLIAASKLHVRVYTRGRLHAKAYIFNYGAIYDASGNAIPRPEKGIAIVGSSNFSLSGVSHNSELNVIVSGNSNHEALTAWFNELWDESEDFKPALMVELKNSWAQAVVSPYDIYLKTLYELVKDRLDTSDEPVTVTTTEIMSALTEFQSQAVRRAVRMIHAYGGCFVSDVVGLGKSYIGSAIIKYFERTEQARPLIICPAPLVDGWERYNEVYKLNARVLSMGYLREDSETGITSLMSDIRYRDRDFVLIDESHNFRNSNTQRYRVLEEFLSQGRRCILLTATPQNKSVHDIYNQMKLFHQADQTTLPIHPPNLREYFKLVEEGKRPLPSLLSNILIRRTRNHVLRWHGYDSDTNLPIDPNNFAPYRSGERQAYILVQGKPQVFPKRELKTVEYSIEDTYQGLYQQLRSYMGQSSDAKGDKQLTYARYGLWHYVSKSKQGQSPYVELQRAGANLRGLMRISMFKRLESSIHAFRETLRRQLRIHDTFLRALKNGIIAAGEEAQTILYESDTYDETELLDALASLSETYRAEDFNVVALQRDIERDCRILHEMLDCVEVITPKTDKKLQTLLERFDRELLGRSKCLIFTQYADTARYLYDNLKHHSGTAVIYSDRSNKMTTVGQFAPKSNPEYAPTHPNREINLLIATDVLSEGLNLQDCDTLINYDLHWNPVRLIQRFGRIDRIGSTHNRIYGFNFLPETGLDAHLGLREKLAARIAEIHNTIGEDTAVLDPNEHINEEAIYAIYSGKDISLYEDDGNDQAVELDEAEEIIQQLRRNDPKRYEQIGAMRYGVGTAQARDGNSTFVFCRAGQYYQLYLIGEEDKVVSREIPLILGKLRCDADQLGTSLPKEHNAKVAKILKQFEREIAERRAQSVQKTALSRSQQYVLAQLRIIHGLATEQEIRQRVELLQQVFKQKLPRIIISQLDQIRRLNPTDDELINELYEIHERYKLNVLKIPESDVQRDDETPIIVCSEAFVE